MPSQLTTVERVKAQLFAGVDLDPSTYDELIDQLVQYTNSRIEVLCERVFAEASYTELYDGTGTDALYLRQGPLVTLTTLKSVVYSDGGAGARALTKTAVDAYQFVEGGQRANGYHGTGHVRLLGSAVFTRGTLNYEVAYTAGFVDDSDEGADNYPQALVAAATNYAAAMFNLRDLHGLTSRDVGDGELRTTIPMANLEQALVSAVARYRVVRAVACR